MFRSVEPILRRLELRIADLILVEVEAHGIEGVRVSTLAERAEVSVGTLYKRWGGREAMLEHTWRTVLLSLEREVQRTLAYVNMGHLSVEQLWQALRLGLPEQLDAFFELHNARRRWHRADIDSDGVLIPSLVTFVELGQRFGVIRKGPPRLFAALIWWVTAGALAGPGRDDAVRMNEGLGALKRVLLEPEALGDEILAGLEITVDEPEASQPVYLFQE